MRHPAELIFRRATADDALIASTILIASIEQLCFPDHGGDAEILKNWTANKKPHRMTWLDRAVTLIGLWNGVPCALGALDHTDGIALNYVHPDFRFRGISKALLARLEDELRARGVKTGRLVSSVTAHEFYKSAGWADSAPPEYSFGMPGYPMTKSLC